MGRIGNRRLAGVRRRGGGIKRREGRCRRWAPRAGLEERKETPR